VTRTTWSKALKGLYAGAVTFVGQLTTVLTGSTTLGSVTEGQWASISLFTLVAVGGVFGLAGWSGPGSGSGEPKPVSGG
jgi:hypothetical protein